MTGSAGALVLALLRQDWDAPAHADTIGALCRATDWQTFEDEANGARVLAIATDRLSRTPAAAALVPSALLARGRAQQRCGAALSRTAELVALELEGRCARDGIAVLAIKGPDLGKRIYGQRGLRPFVDLDALVAPEALDGAVAAARAMGYVPEPEPLDVEGRPLLHHRLLPARPSLPPIELHWRLHWYEESFAADAVRRAREPRLEPADELAAMLLFYARDGLQGLRYPADIAAWMRRYADALDSDCLARLTRAHAALDRPLTAAANAVDALVGTRVSSLLSPRAHDTRSATAARLATPAVAATAARARSQLTVVDVLLAPPGATRAAVGRWLIPRAAVEQRAPSARDVVAGAPGTLRRAASLLAFLAQSRLLRRDARARA